MFYIPFIPFIPVFFQNANDIKKYFPQFVLPPDGKEKIGKITESDPRSLTPDHLKVENCPSSRSGSAVSTFLHRLSEMRLEICLLESESIAESNS